MKVSITNVVDSFEGSYKNIIEQEKYAKKDNDTKLLEQLKATKKDHDLQLMKALQVEVRKVDSIYKEIVQKVELAKSKGKGHMGELEDLINPKLGAGKDLPAIEREVLMVKSIDQSLQKAYETMYESLSDWRASTAWSDKVRETSFNLAYLETMNQKSEQYVTLGNQFIVPEIRRISAYNSRATAILLAASKASKAPKSKLSGHEYDELLAAFNEVWKGGGKGSPFLALAPVEIALEKLKSEIKTGPQKPYSSVEQARLDGPEQYAKNYRGAVKTLELHLKTIDQLIKSVDKDDLSKWKTLRNDVTDALKKSNVAKKQLEEYSKLKPKMIEAYKKYGK